MIHTILRLVAIVLFVLAALGVKVRTHQPPSGGAGLRLGVHADAPRVVRSN